MKLRRILGTLVLVFALVLGVTGGIMPEKAKASNKTEKVTLLKGEKYKISILIGGNITSAKSSKKSVLAVKRDGSYAVVCTAKKAGKSTVTIRTSRGGTKKYVFTVKNAKIDCNLVSLAVTQSSSGKYNSIAAFQIVNKSGVYIPSAKIAYSLTGDAGMVLESDAFTVSDLLPGATIYKTVDYSFKDAPIVSATAKMEDFSRYSAETKYLNMSSKINVTQTAGDLASGSMSFTMKNTTKKTVSGESDVIFKDAAGNIIYVRGMSFYLKSKGVATTDVTYIPDGAVTYQVVTRAYARA